MIEGSVGILMINSMATAATTALTPVAAAGTNSNNKFYTNTINGGNYGMGLIGFAGATPFTTAIPAMMSAASLWLRKNDSKLWWWSSYQPFCRY